MKPKSRNSDKRKLGPLLKLIKEGDIIICSEISRLGRDLYMVMDILHFCMEKKAKIYTVKDNFVLGDDIQSKVLAFAFGLAAEIERQMIRQRTKEGLRMRVKLGVLVGRPGGVMEHSTNACCLEDKKEQVIEQYKWGVPDRRLAENFGVDRATIVKWLHRWGVRNCPSVDKIEAQDNVGKMALEYGKERAEGIDMKKLTILIEGDLTIPEIARQFPEYTYEQIYGTILCTKELNLLYRKHGQKKVLKKKR